MPGVAITTGETVATTTPGPPDEIPFTTTIAVIAPTAAGSVERLIVKDVDVGAGEEATVPVAPFDKVTTLLEAVVENPAPVTTMLVDVIGREFAGVAVTAGIAFPTTTAEPLDKPYELTTAAMDPTFGRGDVNASVRDVGEATETVKVLEGTLVVPLTVNETDVVVVGRVVESKPVPRIWRVEPAAADTIAVVFVATVGGLRTVATTVDGLDRVKEVTTA